MRNSSSFFSAAGLISDQTFQEKSQQTTLVSKGNLGFLATPISLHPLLRKINGENTKPCSSYERSRFVSFKNHLSHPSFKWLFLSSHFAFSLLLLSVTVQAQQPQEIQDAKVKEQLSRSTGPPIIPCCYKL